MAIRAARTIGLEDRTFVAQSRPRNFVFYYVRLPRIDSVAFFLLSPARMQRTGGRCFYARLLSYPARRNRYRFLIAQRHTEHQKKTIMVLGFLAARDYFRNCSPGCNCLRRDVDLCARYSSLKTTRAGVRD